MDPNPTRFPILSYVLSRLHSASHQSAPISDLEAPDPSSSSQSSSRRFETELVERLPYLQHPDMLSSMARAVSDVAQTRSVLQGLGKRPDHETLDAARSHIADIDVELTLQLDEIAYGEADIAEIEKECRVKADAQKLPYKALLNLDEMHEAYEKLLKDAEERLEKIYVSSAGCSFPLMQDEEDESWQLNEEVVAILQEASVKCVERVELSGRRLKFLPEAFGRMRGLVALDVSNNRLESIPDAIAGLEQLQELYLSANLLASLPDSIGLLLKLKILDVSNNKLKVFPDSISNCRSLVELNASYNELTHLPTSIGYGLLNLQELRVYFNKLRSLPASICEMRSLRLLDAHFNELSRLPLEIGKLTNLEILNLSSNFSDLTELPPSFGDLISLRELDASNNQIRALPEFFFRLHNLSRLNLDQNPLLVPPPEIAERGAVTVRLYMKNWHEALLEEERRRRADEAALSGSGWLTRSTSWLNGFASRVSGTVAEYLGESFSDPCLYEQR